MKFEVGDIVIKDSPAICYALTKEGWMRIVGDGWIGVVTEVKEQYFSATSLDRLIKRDNYSGLCYDAFNLLRHSTLELSPVAYLLAGAGLLAEILTSDVFESEIPNLPSTIECYKNMFKECKPMLGIYPKHVDKNSSDWDEDDENDWDEDDENEIEKIIFNEPVTILFARGKKYRVKAHKEKFDKEKGLALALLKMYGISYLDLKKMIKNATDQKENKKKKKEGKKNG